MLVSPSGRLGVDPVTGLEITGFTENGWVGLSLLHGLFALEHNAICDELKKHNPLWDDERLFQQARLVNAALLAKIHTVEWSTAILPREVLTTGLRTNWYGRFSKLQNVFPGLADNDIFSGIPGSPTDHHGVPFSLTEEFVSVYRMHTLMPDHFTIRSADTGEGLANAELPELAGRRGVEFLARFNLADLFYSFGIHNPGAVRLHNYPKFLQNLVRDNGERFDLGAIDILRDRERGVPRYNRFRRLLHKAPVKSFEELTDNPDVGRRDEAGLQQRPRDGRHDGRPDGRAAAGGDGLQRHRLPHLPADGVAPAQERSIPVPGLSPGDLHETGHRVGGRELDEERDLAALPVGRVRDGGAGRRQRLQAVGSRAAEPATRICRRQMRARL